MNQRNKILTKEQINKMANEKMQELLKPYPPYLQEILIQFNQEVSKLNFWVREKMEKIEIK